MQINKIQNIDDDIWFQAAQQKNTVVDNINYKVIISPNSMTETIIWVQSPKQNWRIIALKDVAHDIIDRMQRIGVDQAINELNDGNDQ